jgi:hypothetical protein
MGTKLTAAAFQAAAKARGIAVPKAQMKPVLAGAVWLKDCVALLRQAKLGK